MTILPEKIRQLDLKHNIGITREEFKKLTIALSKQATASIDNEDSFLGKIEETLTKLRQMNPLEQEATAKSEEDFKKCFVCGEVGEPATVMGDRDVYYCKKHHVVIPKRAKKTEG